MVALLLCENYRELSPFVEYIELVNFILKKVKKGEKHVKKFKRNIITLS